MKTRLGYCQAASADRQRDHESVRKKKAVGIPAAFHNLVELKLLGAWPLLGLIRAGEIAEVAFGHFAGGSGNALLLDGFGCFLAGLSDLASHLDGALLLKARSRRVAVEDDLSLVELPLRLCVERTRGFLFAQRPTAGCGVRNVARSALFGKVRLTFTRTLSARILGVLKSLELLAKVAQVVVS
jgi:hypothetical protein